MLPDGALQIGNVDDMVGCGERWKGGDLEIAPNTSPPINGPRRLPG